MPHFQFGDTTFWITPVTVMKCFVSAANWRVRGTSDELCEFQTFTGELFPFLIQQPNDMGLDAFTSVAVSEIDAIQRRRGLRSDFIAAFSTRLKKTLTSTTNHNEAWRATRRYRDWFESWVDTPLGEVARGAAAEITEWDVEPLEIGLAAVGAFGNAIYGKYVHPLRAVCIQLDVICGTMNSQLNFIETLLHEQVHAAIHARMGDEQDRLELLWLNELAAVLTSQHAIFRAALATGNHELIGRVATGLKTLRDEQQYGGLANSVKHATLDALLPWRAWQAVFDLPPELRSQYARNRVITPILHELGWPVAFPYRYGDYSVSVFV